ncbi:TetR/AcrR family transcriptional regulator [Nocardiopsis mangrovi]|uniref:TetR/AcrR family transcriptional regulator n=1 Tax=Nocardiopsis mangrovi TaxID=1179818 RepID=A0ABV9E0M0_9ACTN
MRQNPERRAALLDAAIEVLAREGARGLTFRAVDVEAAVPKGTASNYFANRDELFTQVGGRFYERLAADPGAAPPGPEGPRDRRRMAAVMRAMVDRITEFRSGYLALLELRLEAVRRPELRAVLTRAIRADIDANVDSHLASGFPGDATTVVSLHLALNWLITERLTLPGVFSQEQADAIVDELVDRLVPPAAADGTGPAPGAVPPA